MGDELRRNALLAAGVLTAAIVAVVVVYLLLTALAARAFGRTPAAESAIRRSRWPVLLLLAALTALSGIRAIGVSDGEPGSARHVASLVVIAAVAWTLVALVSVASDIVAGRFDVGSADNLRARRVHTQATILRRVAGVVIGVAAIAVMLTTFPSVRTLGASILASAGIAGIVLGLAAQQTLGNLIAGIQIAVTEPIRLDDVVLLEGEYGRIDEITFTYVVVALWDERRLILPISYFTTTPFENWTRSQSQITGSVQLHVDHAVPVDDLRAELSRVLRRSPLWDGRQDALQVVESHPHTMEVRALVSARDAPSAWDLRCEVREALVAFICAHHPDSLPRLRADVGSASPLALTT
jgi:small-conductance mechanosensitive channel